MQTLGARHSTMGSLKPLNMRHSLLREITGGFSDEIGRGTFGVVYKGELKDGRQIAVKILKYMPEIDGEKFNTELTNLTMVKHPNIIQLVGFCNETEEVEADHNGNKVSASRMHRALCFEYMHHGSLNKHISDDHRAFGWHTRYRIIKGICEGLKYLHMGLETPIIHLDLKPENILLDKNMVPKIADFGLSWLLATEGTIRDGVGTRGYMPPEYISNKEISNKFDIFSLGIIILKIINGPAGYSQTDGMEPDKFVEHVSNKWRERLQVEPRCTSLETDCQQVKKCIELALLCIAKEYSDRPTVESIVHQLKETEKRQNLPTPSIDEITEDEESTISKKSNIPANRSQENDTNAHEGKISKSEPCPLLPPEVSLEFLMEITNGFSYDRKHSEGAFGTIYKGILRDGQEIAVKKLAGNTVVPAGKHFLKEATNLMLLNHENILKILSVCSEAKKKVVEHKGKYILVDIDECVLCYEFASKGSLRDYILDDTNRFDYWDTSFKIIKGICCGLHFLHEENGAPIVHLDLQPANILLDENMVPKIADFGLSRFFGQEQTRINTINVIGPKGYMAPEYLYSGEISPQCDIYSLGVIILEITTREKNNCADDKDMAARNFIIDIRETWTDGHIASVYSTLDSKRMQEVKTCIISAFKCVDLSPKNRPSIVEIVDILYRKRSSGW